jgi:hypothetical protein
MRCGTRNMRSLCRAGSPTAAAGEMAKCKLEPVGVEEIRWDRSGTESASGYAFLYGQGNEIRELGT